MIIKHLNTFVITLGLLATSAFAEQGSVLEQAEQLIRSGQGVRAYELLAPDQFAQAGNPDFDYLFGLAALDAGHPGVATLAFERVLAVSPNHGAARLDMGRAYFALGDLPRARREFDLAQALNPPPAARATMARYLAEMDARDNAPATRFSGYVEAGLGSDSNVTQGPSSSTLFLPLFGVNFTLNAANQKTRDDFSQVNVGAEVTHRLDDTVSLYGGVDAKWRNYNQVTAFSYGSADWRGGVQWQDGRDTWRVGTSYSDYRLDQQQYRTIASLNGEFRHSVNERQQLMFFGQHSQVRYIQDVLINNNVDQWVAGAGWVSQLETSLPTTVSLSAYAGSETEADRSRPRVDGDKIFFGLRAGAQVTPRADIDVFATAGVQAGNYQRSNILYDRKRADGLYELATGGIWRFAPAWSLKPQITWLHNSSNVSVNDYERYEISVFLRRDFQ